MAEAKRLYAFIGTWQTFGGKGDGIYAYEVGADGSLQQVAHFQTKLNTSMLCVSQDGRFVYANDERKDYGGAYGMGGGVVALAFDADKGELHYLNQQMSMGSCPAYVAVDATGRFVAVANHGTNPNNATTIVRDQDGKYAIRVMPDDASTAIFPVQADGSLAPASCVQVHPPKGGGLRPAHCHSVTFSPDNRLLLACDKGVDRIYAYTIDENGYLQPTWLHHQPPEPFQARNHATPRHLAFHPSNPSMFFTSNEYEYSVSSYALDGDDRIRELQALSTDFDELVCGRRDTPGTTDVRVHPNGRFVYVSNRTTNNGITGYSAKPVSSDYENGTMSVFELNGDRMRLVARQSLSCGNPRAFNITPDGRFLYVADLDRDSLTRYPIDPQTGRLCEASVAAQIPSPSSLVFVQIAERSPK